MEGVNAIKSKSKSNNNKSNDNMEGTKPIVMIMEGTKPVNMEGTPPLRGEPYPTL